MSTNLSSLITNSIPGAQGEKNYLATGASTSQGWTASGAGITVGTDSTAINLPRPNTTLTGIKFTGVSGSTAYAYYRFILDDADVGKTLKIQWDQKPGTAVSSDFKVDVYSFTASDYSTGSARVSLSTDSSAVTAIPSATGTFKSSFTGPAITSKWIEVRIGLNASATHTLYVSDVIVGPGVVQQGYAGDQWRSVTALTITGTTSNPTKGTTTEDSCYVRREGDSMRIRYTYLQTAAGSAGSGTYLWTIPLGLTIDTTKLSASANMSKPLGVGYAYDGTNEYVANALYYDSTHLYMQFYTSPTNLKSTANITSANVGLSGTNARYFFEVVVPIAEWAGSGTVNIVQNDVEYAYSTDVSATATVTGAYGYGPVGSAFGAAWANGTSWGRDVSFQTPIQPGQVVLVQVSQDSGASWGDAPSAGIAAYNEVPGTRAYGITWVKQSASVVRIYFNSGGRTLATTAAGYGAAGSPWSDLAGGVFRWRLVKCYPNQAVGFSEVNPGISAGLVSASGVKGRTDGGTVAAGYIGERISSPNWSQTSCSTTTGDVTNATLALTPGVWRIHVSVGLDVSTGAVSGNNTRCSVILTDSSNAIVGTAYRSHYLKTVAAVANEVIMTCAFDETISISAAATYKLRCGRTDGAGTGGGYVTPNNDPVYGGSFFAIRIA